LTILLSIISAVWAVCYHLDKPADGAAPGTDYDIVVVLYIGTSPVIPRAASTFPLSSFQPITADVTIVSGFFDRGTFRRWAVLLFFLFLDRRLPCRRSTAPP